MIWSTPASSLPKPMNPPRALSRWLRLAAELREVNVHRNSKLASGAKAPVGPIQSQKRTNATSSLVVR